MLANSIAVFTSLKDLMSPLLLTATNIPCPIKFCVSINTVPGLFFIASTSSSLPSVGTSSSGIPAACAASTASNILTIGGYYSSSFLLNGYIDDFRITLKARYTSNFTVPDAQHPSI